ncbi:hypothetical protein [Listeria booriae]|uniref:hypothetical protein n=1 Tax=Listeria booriae TaxID=1552123 RepID=UPI001629D218|nr:hypothetical protein [Listeria booriae]MBC1212428.1 hypothetical protein [Listeria booriae]MBC1309302.1 hypothetical protein [Listeria booriae]
MNFIKITRSNEREGLLKLEDIQYIGLDKNEVHTGDLNFFLTDQSFQNLVKKLEELNLIRK